MPDWILHLDLDQFIAAVEILRRPELRGRPLVVGGDGDPTKRGVVSTASYEARAFGVHSGQPLRTAARRCPDAVFLPVDRAAYEEASAQVFATLRDSGAVIEPLGWDEAFLAHPALRRVRDPEVFAQEIQRRVRLSTRLDSSVGIGHTKLQAKTATGFGKPRGVFRLTAENWFAVLGDLGTDALWGIGPKTSRKLAELGVHSVRQLATASDVELAQVFGPTTGPWLVRLANGGDESPVTGAPWVPRSAGQEHTFQVDVADWAEVRDEVARMAADVARAALADGRGIARVVVKVRFAPFFTETHGRVLSGDADDETAVVAAAMVALDRFERRKPVRLIGVRAEFRSDDA
ncbi:MAG: DNA polymerase IV [Hamadaea sp.]|uniref:DNA polymerase IV n=1 Tax=Hamadaea sp. TaxID=2024425 RepID=UPI0017BE3879|nr:DNA polymerase IV [Hamadaea sp.]NUR72817.1 DNA polymerase IV [Hamadaea sp.]NUT20468.1 DNA polymerase IV [Hamadaea sp.]